MVVVAASAEEPEADVDEEEEEDEEEEDDHDWEGNGHDDVGHQDEAKVQRKLHLFQNGSIQRSIKRLWDMLPKDESGNLPMSGYIALNISLQKCLTQEFVLDRAVDSAIGDWAEDVRDGQETMTVEEFSMFLFELCSLWCGPSISLRVYLLFLNAVFIAATDARGAHTVGLKAVDAVERLPDAFFELLSVQGWAKMPEEEHKLDEVHAMGAWHARNLHPDAEQASLLQVQRQIFQITHDVRSVLLFKKKEGKKGDDQDLLDLVKTSSRNLSKVSQVDPQLLSGSSAGRVAKSHHGSARGPLSADMCPRPWCPPTHERHPGPPGPPGAIASTGEQATAQAAAVCKHQRGRSAPGVSRRREPTLPAMLDRPPLQVSRLNHSCKSGQLALPPPAPGARRSALPSEVPVGRTFDVVESQRPRGLILAGQSTLAAVTEKAAAAGWSSVTSPTPQLGVEAKDGYVPSKVQFEATRTTPVAASVETNYATYPPVSLQAKRLPGEELQEGSLHSDLLAEVARRISAGDNGQVTGEVEPTFLEGTALSPPYRLPVKPPDLYKMQTEPALKVLPSTVVFAANKWQMQHPLLGEPFERSLKKLPEHTRPSSLGPSYGPLAHPNEPIWFEMSHRLQAILKRQGRRAERKRKRRLRSKLFRGRSGKKPETRQEGQQLREYLDSKAAEHAQGLREAPGEAHGEFLQKVHERYLLNRERLEATPFRYRGTGGAVVDVYGIGEVPEKPRAVVRPVYVPPPPMQ